MQITTKQLRIQPGRIISQVNKGQEVTVTYRGEPLARIIPIMSKKNTALKKTEDELFGLWKGREGAEDVEQYVRNMRRGRKF